MAVYYKFKSAVSKDGYRCIAVDGAFISVGTLIQNIRETRHFCSDSNQRNAKRDIMVVTNAQTNEPYLDEASLIPRNTSVIIRRLPRPPFMAIGGGSGEPGVEDKVDAADSGEPDWHDFGPDVFEVPKVVAVQATPKESGADDDKEDSKIKALVSNTTEYQFQYQYQGLPKPPQGYVCHRCNVAGHFIQHCPTNGDPNYDIKRVRPATGIPKSMLLATADGSYALPSGEVAVLTPDQAAFEKEVEGLSSAQSSVVGALPPELHCPLCKQVMKDAVLTSKCCFDSFCDKCIRNYLMSTYKSNSGCVCFCGATHSLADDLIPNMTLRETISRLLACGGGNTISSSGSCSRPSPTLSVAASKGEVTLKIQKASAKPAVVAPPQQIADDVSEVTYESMNPRVQEDQVQKTLSSAAEEAGQKRKRVNEFGMLTATDLQCQGGSSQDQYPAANNYMMPTAYNAYWNWMQGMGLQEGYMAPYGGSMPSMGYGFGDQGYKHMPMVQPQVYESNNDDRHFKRRRSGYEAVAG